MRTSIQNGGLTGNISIETMDVEYYLYKGNSTHSWDTHVQELI